MSQLMIIKNETPVEEVRERAMRPSIVQHFSISGVFGYRTVSLDSKFAATVLIAKNGSGKTTLLGALDAFLRGQFTRLASLDFDSITCSLRGIDEPIEIKKSEIDNLLELCLESDFIARSKTWEVEPLALLELLESDIDRLTPIELYQNNIFHSIYMKMTTNNINEAIIKLKVIAEKIKSRAPHLAFAREQINELLKHYEIVYLPTYRRIEISIPTPENRPGRRKQSILARLGVSKRGLHTGEINFGLSDISDRLTALYRDIQTQSNQGYGKVSANIINDLVTGAWDNEPGPEQRPTKEELQLFFARLKGQEVEYRFSPISNLAVPDIDVIYSDDVPIESKRFLDYFLGQLNLVIQKTQGIESTVEQFIKSCNKYLSDEDSSTTHPKSAKPRNNDDKVLNFSRKDLKVSVSSCRTNRKIPLDALSSGEKQMISLFAQLYLYPKQKIVLIDEPELSLSLGWQRKILPDILSASTCEQVIAITHSPFIFDNALEPFASSLKLKFSTFHDNNILSDFDIIGDSDPTEA
jgi:predicted ATPase